MVTAAGKPCYKAEEHPKRLVTPMDFVKQRIEDRIRDIIEKDKTGALAEQLLGIQSKEN